MAVREHRAEWMHIFVIYLRAVPTAGELHTHTGHVELPFFFLFFPDVLPLVLRLPRYNFVFTEKNKYKW